MFPSKHCVNCKNITSKTKIIARIICNNLTNLCFSYRVTIIKPNYLSNIEKDNYYNKRP